MADFKLDIDYPYEIIKKENLYSKPGKVQYSQPDMTFRHYGKTLEKMIDLASDYPDKAQREQLILLIANHMKKSYVQWNKEVDDKRIFIDLHELSKVRIDLRNSDIKLSEAKEQQPKKQKNNNNNQKKNK